MSATFNTALFATYFGSADAEEAAAAPAEAIFVGTRRFPVDIYVCDENRCLPGLVRVASFNYFHSNRWRRMMDD